MAYRVLEAVARSRQAGVSQVELASIAHTDARNLFHGLKQLDKHQLMHFYWT
jgi:hypothetical protein